MRTRFEGGEAETSCSSEQAEMGRDSLEINACVQDEKRNWASTSVYSIHSLYDHSILLYSGSGIEECGKPKIRVQYSIGSRGTYARRITSRTHVDAGHVYPDVLDVVS